MSDSRKPAERVRDYESRILAPYAAYSSRSKGRKFPQREHPLRSAYQRDRDRVIHSAAFRRMEYKTQVFVNHEGDHYRTRLTHTIEVAQISRTIARALGLNEDLAEAIALVHDLGHTPFGHSGEDALDELMAAFGGFNHNRQSLRVVDFLERRYPDFPGLNLTYEVREGIIKHETWSPQILTDEFPTDDKPTLEAALVDIADSIAYNSHDVDDGLSSGILDRTDMEQVPIFKDAVRESEKLWRELDPKLRRHSLVRLLVDWQVTDLITETSNNIDRYGIDSLDAVRRCRQPIISFSSSVAARVEELKRYLSEKMYRHPRLQAMSDDARKIIVTLFQRYKEEPSRLHGKFKLRLGKEPLELIIADFIAGMTDRYALKMYEELK
ncbi:MAG: deoxyguanosinetriphosphate triphosphohydrolase [bacterium]|jgi:dGTPase